MFALTQPKDLAGLRERVRFIADDLLVFSTIPGVT